MQDDPDSEKRELAQQYAEILASELSGSESGPGAEGPSHLKHEQVAEDLNAKVEELSQERLTVSLGSRELPIEPLFNNVSKHIIAAKDLISSAAGADPHAALACAGGLVILTFLVRPIEQREHILRGLELTSSLICRYFAMEQVYRPQAHIIEFQARALCYLQRSRPTRFIRDMFRGDTWKALIEEIERLDAQCRAIAELITHDKILTFVELPSQKTEPAIVTFNLPKPVSNDLLRRRTKLLNRLYTCLYRDRKDINPERAPGTCEWFTEHEYFRDWIVASESRMLWVSADPGAGKSVLARYLVDDVCPSTPDRTTSYFFFKDGFDDQRSASTAMCAVLRQILEQNSELMEESTVAKFEADGNHLLNSFSRLFDVLLEAAMKVETEVTCLFDAPDECNGDDCRQVTSTLAKFYKNPPDHSRLKFIITSRLYTRIQRSLQPLKTSLPTIHLRGDDESNTERISGEIGIVIRHRLQGIAQIQLLEAKEVNLLEESLLTWQHRTYLWVKLAIDFIESRLESPTQENVEIIFNSVPEKLDGLYEKILEQSANKERARKAFHIILGAYRPLSLSEISGALCVESHHQYTSQTCQEPIKKFPSYLREICGLFVTIVDGNVYLLHETAREFLAYRPGHKGYTQLSRRSRISSWPKLAFGIYSWRI
ncbi:uncharacterized protein BDZ83DRAFT_719521 [Colletotrichum acutatum]|uniref:NWD NACHT-NTPase N-terminal domain-containing protein n=1 Tax=Glomerella acutata TaxID=27357 RepID=A0AAD8XG26_GLOAC|nr:uncharacterized protein BDZ83DRAFT_719521 [Colletotrichum acutatum]KAK1724921.1 hypothetical protein BDZ83DRAFT_719521 [Colletotrichum acutatum]